MFFSPKNASVGSDSPLLDLRFSRLVAGSNSLRFGLPDVLLGLPFVLDRDDLVADGARLVCGGGYMLCGTPSPGGILGAGLW